MNVITDPKQAGERLLQFARENRLVQNTWHDETDGREVACLLGAAAGIIDVNQCPASLMPRWLAHALPSLFDAQTKVHAMSFARRWGEAMIRPEWAQIDWTAVRSEWLAFVVAQAKDAARVAANADNAAYAAIYAAKASALGAVLDADAALYAVEAAAKAAVLDAADAAARSASAADAACYAARDGQADALMDAIEKAMEVARG